MPEYLAPGVYVEEVPSGPLPIEGVSTSTTGTVGLTERGPTQPHLVNGWGEYQAWYGGLLHPSFSFLPWAVRGFFDNGGKRLFVARIVRSNALAARLNHDTDGPPQQLAIEANGKGAWGNNVFIRIKNGNYDPNNVPPNPPVSITILYYRTLPPTPLVDPFDAANIADPNRREPDVVEQYENVGWLPESTDYLLPYINARSKLIDLDWADATQPPARPQLTTGFVQLDTVVGTDGTNSLSDGDFLGDDSIAPGTRVGLAGLAEIDQISILAVPDHVNDALLTATEGNALMNQVVNQCELLRDRFAVISAAAGAGDVSTLRPPRDTSYGAFYTPWIRVSDPGSGDTYLVPPVGHVAGIYAHVDVQRGVHKAPANEVLSGIVTIDINSVRKPLEFPFGKGAQDILNPLGVNVIRDFRFDSRRGIRVYGARTMSSDPTLRYINVRRLLLYIEESIDEGTQWAVFEPNDDALWARVKQSIDNFLDQTWRSGALQGTTRAEAYFVRCDRTTMTQADIDSGRLICVIGVAPTKPAEFVIIRIMQRTPANQ